MRTLGSTSRFTLSVSAIALGTVFATPAFAQTDTQTQQAQKQNTAVDCSTVTDPAQHADCIRTQTSSAQTPATAGAPEQGAIVVTGSRIPKPNYDTVQPATVIDSKAIEQRGFANAADALNELPQFGIPGSSPVGAGQGGAFGTGQSFVNFLGLGSQRTLVLVNGRRFISSNTSSIFGPTSAGEQVDLGQINTKLIDRIETIAIGGAPIYGSDAIAGTINVILKHDYQGFDIDGQNGISDEGDAHNWRIRALAGRNFADGRGNVTVSAEYNKGKGFTYNDRALFRRGLFYDNCPPDSQFTQCLYQNGPRVNSVYPGGAPVVGADLVPLSPEQMEALVGLPGFIPGLGRTTFGVTDANGNDVAFDSAGNLIPIDYGLNPGGAGDLFSSGGNGFAYIRDTSQALSDTERYNANLIGHFDVTDNIRLFAEGWYSHSKSTNLAAQPEYNSGIFDSAGQPAGNLLLSVDNPFLTPSQRALITSSIQNNPFSDQNINCTLASTQAEVDEFCSPGQPTQDYFYLSRANTDIPTGFATYTDNIWRIVGGLDGKFNLLAGQWNWEVVGNLGRSKADGKQVDINTQNFFNAVGAITDDNPTGVPCLAGLANSPYPTFSSTCAPFNPFGSGRSNQAAYDYILSPIRNQSTNKQFVFTADVSGPVAKLPGGDLSLAAGVEHRAESTFNNPSPFYHGPDPDPTVDENGDGDPTDDIISYGQTVPIAPIKGRFHTNEVFGELNADVISPSNAIKGIYRFDVQAAARYVDHSVAGGDITWTVGGRYAPVRDISFRGNFTHAIRAPSIQEAFIPTSTFFGFAVDPCDKRNSGSGPDPSTRQANCIAEGIDPATFVSQAGSRSFLQSTGGNADLKNEKSDAYSIGTVITPRFVPRLYLSVDYINVKLKEAISAFSGSQVLDACYDAPDPASNPFCSLITRNASHQITFIATSFYNAAQLHYRGIVASWDYKANTPFLGNGSTLGFSGSYQHLLELSNTANAGAAPAESAGTLGYPKNSFAATLNYVRGPLSLFTNANYTGSVNQGVEEPANFREHQRIKSFLYFNGGGSLNVGEHFRFFIDVDNIFNRKPPFPVPAFGGAVTYYPGVLGRYYRFGAGVHF